MRHPQRRLTHHALCGPSAGAAVRLAVALMLAVAGPAACDAADGPPGDATGTVTGDDPSVGGASNSTDGTTGGDTGDEADSPLVGADGSDPGGDDPTGGGTTAQGAGDPGQDDPPVTDTFGLVSVEPNAGAVEGGFSVVLTGTGFRIGMTVLLGNSPVEDLFIVNDVLAVFTAPPHPPGFVSVIAFHEDIDDGAPVEIVDGFKYEAELLVAELTPTEGGLDGGEEVTVLGTGFEADARLYIDGRPALEQHRVDGNTLVGIAPPGAQAGPVDVQVTAGGLVTEAPGLYRYWESPRIEALAPLSGPAAGGTLVRLVGGGLSLDAVVRFDAEEATVVDAAADGSWLEVWSPPGPPEVVADIEVLTSWGDTVASGVWAWGDPDADPYLLDCTHMWPVAGPAAGGTTVRIACSGLQYGGDVRFGGQDAVVTLVDPGAGFVEAVAPSGTPGTADITVSHVFDSTTLESAFSYLAAPPLQVHAVTPSSGPVSGGHSVVIEGAGLTEDALVWFGALPALSVQWQAGTLHVETPPGGPGGVDVRVRHGDVEARLEDGYLYSDGALALSVVAPHQAAQAGGTFLRVLGDGFDDDTRVFFGGVEAEVVAVASPAELHVRSPALDIGLWDGRVVSGTGDEAVLAGALTTFDPRSGYSGTWGGPIDGALNVTVRGSNGFGPVAGAYVMLSTPSGATLDGYTNAQGQVTLSEPWLVGPVQVTASAPGFTSYSIVDFDGRNVTMVIRLLDPPPGSGSGVTFPPDAVLQGRVLGLDKYVTPTAGSCDLAPSTGQSDCATCEPELGCGAEGYGCVDLLEQGHRCLAECEVPADCADGYVCAGVDTVARCIPDPGDKIARCGVSAQTVFSTDIYSPPTAWVGVGEQYELQSTRLGDLAVICWGGYRTPSGIFTPTVMGVRRHVHALSAQVLDGLDVELNHPLREIFRLRLQSPPTWPGGINKPSVTISIDLGADGAIPMTRPLLERGEHLYLAPHQLSALDGDLYDASYSFYSSISASTPTAYPVAYNLVQLVTTVVEPRLPVLVDGQWTLESTELREDLFALWGTADDALFAVGADGLILRYNGLGWYAQTSNTGETLRAVHGRAADDVWAAGDAGALVHWDGISWQPVDAPQISFASLATAPDHPLWLAGDVRVHRYDSEGDAWSVEGPPWVQGVQGLALFAGSEVGPEGQLAAASTGARVAVRDDSGGWHLHIVPTDTDGATPALNAVAWLDAQTWIAVGDAGLVAIGGVSADAPPTVIEVGTDEVLTAVTVTSTGRIHIVGDNGVAVSGQDGLWTLDDIPDYRARAEAVFAPAGSEFVRVVGGVAFVLGPYLRYPVAGGPIASGSGGGLTLPFSWDGGPAAQYTRLIVSPEYAPSIWTLIVDGDQESATLPDLQLLAGLEGVGSGSRRLELMRVLNLNFDIDAYTSREFSIYRRTSWSVNQSVFFAP